jgi:hypothetical protein
MEDNPTIQMEVDCLESSKDNFQLLVSLLVSQWKENVYASKSCETLSPQRTWIWSIHDHQCKKLHETRCWHHRQSQCFKKINSACILNMSPWRRRRWTELALGYPDVPARGCNIFYYADRQTDRQTDKLDNLDGTDPRAGQWISLLFRQGRLGSLVFALRFRGASKALPMEMPSELKYSQSSGCS